MDEDFEGPEQDWDDAVEWEKDRIFDDQAIERAEEEHQRRLAEEAEEGESALLLSETDLF